MCSALPLRLAVRFICIRQTSTATSITITSSSFFSSSDTFALFCAIPFPFLLLLTRLCTFSSSVGVLCAHGQREAEEGRENRWNGARNALICVHVSSESSITTLHRSPLAPFFDLLPSLAIFSFAIPPPWPRARPVTAGCCLIFFPSSQRRSTRKRRHKSIRCTHSVSHRIFFSLSFSFSSLFPLFAFIAYIERSEWDFEKKRRRRKKN